MSDDTMSQSQVESLLRAIAGEDESSQRRPGTAAVSAANGDTHSTESAAASPARPAAKPASPAEVVSPYDFKRPERVGQEQMRALHCLHETVASNFAAVVAGMLRMHVDVQLVKVEQITYGRFVASLETPSSLHVLSVQPLEGNWLLEIAPSLSSPLIDRLLGGDAQPGPLMRRPLTAIENRLVGRLVTALLDQLDQAWQPMEPLQGAVQRVESHPQLVQLVPPGEVVISIAFEVTLGNNRGRMNLCMPLRTIERFHGQLTNSGGLGLGEPRATESTRQTIRSNVDFAVLDLVVTLARSKIRTAELMDLAVGDVITTEQEVESPLELSVQGNPKFHARPGAYRGKKAVCIEGLIQP